ELERLADDVLLRHLAEAGPSELADLQLELGLKPKELKQLRAPLERCGAVVSRSIVYEEPHRHTSELSRWDHVVPEPLEGGGLEREQWRQWVAEADEEIVGSAWAGFEWSVPTPGKGRFWVAVSPERRGRGIGGALYGFVEEYLRRRGAWRARTNVDADPAGERFVAKRGFERRGADRVSAFDVRRAELPELSLPAGFRVEPLGCVRDRVEELFAICAAGELDMPGDEPETAFTLEDWKLDDFGVPDLSDEGSFVVLDDERAVSLAL